MSHSPCIECLRGFDGHCILSMHYNCNQKRHKHAFLGNIDILYSKKGGKFLSTLIPIDTCSSVVLRQATIQRTTRYDDILRRARFCLASCQHKLFLYTYAEHTSLHSQVPPETGRVFPRRNKQGNIKNR